MIGIVAEVVDDWLVVLVVDDGRGNILIGLLGVEVVVDILEPELSTDGSVEGTHYRDDDCYH